MKIDIKKTCIVELITIIILSFTLFVFNFTDLKILAAIIVCIGAVIYYLFRRNVTISSNSDKVTKELPIPELTQYIPLEKSAEFWANEILNKTIQRKDTKKEIIEAGYEVKSAALKMQNYYINMEK